MKVESVPLETLKPYDNNAKRHTPEQIEAVGNSIREFWFRNPIIAWHNEDGVAEIVAGHARAAAAKAIGMEEVPVVFADDLTDAQRRALTLVDNQTTVMTGWDEDMLAYELDVLAQDFDMSDFGFECDLSDCMAEEEPSASLADRFGVPPFSVLDARKGEWGERKRAFRSEYAAMRFGARWGQDWYRCPYCHMWHLTSRNSQPGERGSHGKA